MYPAVQTTQLYADAQLGNNILVDLSDQPPPPSTIVAAPNPF